MSTIANQGPTLLLDRARKGWEAGQAEIAHGLVNRFRKRLRAEVDIIETADNRVSFVANLNSIRLRGANDVACLLATGDRDEMEPGIRQFWQLASGPGQLVIVLALSEGVERAAERVIPKDSVCVLNGDGFTALLNANEPVQMLKQMLREQIPLRRLIPYVTRHAVHGNMFYGRRVELEQLLELNTENFAIAGQGRIGKSSLISEYRNQLRRKGGRPAQAYIDFYTCQPRSESAIAQFLAKQMDGTTHRSANMTLDDLEQFIRFHAHRLGHPIEFLLDEVDLVCRSKTFRHLAHISRQKNSPIARLILVGRAELLRETLDEKSPLKQHVSLMRLEPLDEKSAQLLLKEPFNDMGLRFSDDTLIEKILRLTGRLPQLLQYVGSRLARLACSRDWDVISADQLESIWEDFETTEVLTSSLKGLQDPLLRLVAVFLLIRGIHRVDEFEVQRLLAENEVEIEADRALYICDELLLANFLSWTKSGYQIANEAIAIRLKETGVLERAAEEARHELRRKTFQ